MEAQNMRLRQLIDAQDIGPVAQFIFDNPNLNYNQISPNGASALWWALMPPLGRQPSARLIDYLLDSIKNDGKALVDPTQDFAGLTPRQYLNLLDREAFKTIRLAISHAENAYQAPKTVSCLKTFANDKQSAHNSLVTHLSRANTARLHHHYIMEHSLKLDELRLQDSYQEIIKCLLSKYGPYSDIGRQIQSGLDFCFSTHTSFAFEKNKNLATAAFTLTLAQLVTLNWMAANEECVALLPTGANDEAGLASRQQAIFTTLYDIATAYGENSPSCAGGACNRFGMTLAAQHCLVKPHPENIIIKGDAARLIIIRVLNNVLDEVAQNNHGHYLSILRHLTLTTSSTQDKDVFHSFLESVRNPLLQQLIREECVDKTLAHESITALEDDVFPIAPYSRHFQLTQLIRLFEVYSLDLTVFYQNQLTKETLRQAHDLFAPVLIQCASFKHSLTERGLHLDQKTTQHFASVFISHWLQRAGGRSPAFDLHGFIQGISDKSTKDFAVDTLLLSSFSMQKDDLKQHHPKQSLWLETLSHQDIITLMREAKEDLMNSLMLHAITKGITANLSLEAAHFKNMDLRAFDFSGANLNGAVFENCLLPLAGANIQCAEIKLNNCQLTLTTQHSSTATLAKLFSRLCDFDTPPSALITQFFLQKLKAEGLTQVKDEDTALIKAVRRGHSSCVNTLILSEFCSLALLRMPSNEHWPEAALIIAARKGHIDSLNAILKSRHFSTELLKMLDGFGNTALLWAAGKGHVSCVKALLGSPYCTNEFFTMNQDGNALSWAARNGKVNCLHILLASPFCSKELLQTMSKDESPLIQAAYNGHEPCVKALQTFAPALLHTRDKTKTSALMWAVRNNHLSCVICLLSSPHYSTALLMREDIHGFSALSWATFQGNKHATSAILNSPHCTLATLRQAQELSEKALMNARYIAQEMARYTVFLSAWESTASFSGKIAALLENYLSSSTNCSAAPFFSNKAQNAQEVRTLLLEQDTAQEDRAQILLARLNTLAVKNLDEPLMKIIHFIHSRMPSTESHTSPTLNCDPHQRPGLGL